MFKKMLVVFTVLALLAHPAQAKGKKKAVPKKSGPPVYERIGGQAAVEKFSGLFLKRVLADGRIKDYFKGVDPSELAPKVISFVCLALGGPCKYEGRSMKETHEGMYVTNAAFDAFLEDALFTLRELSVPAKETGEILKALNGLRKTVVELK